jgi:hypothetical protein
MLLISLGMEVPPSTPKSPSLAVDLPVDRPDTEKVAAFRCTGQRRAPDSSLVVGGGIKPIRG